LEKEISEIEKGLKDIGIKLERLKELEGFLVVKE